MKRSFIFSFLLAVGGVAWIASGQLDAARQPEAKKPPAQLAAAETVAKVRVRVQKAEPRVAQVLLRGFTEAARRVEIKAEVQGRIAEVPAEKGQKVKAGQVIARLAPDDRPALLRKAKALLAQRRIEFEAASKLSKKGFRSETDLAASKAAVDAAVAEVEQAEVELENLEIRARFAGVIDDRMMELGDFAAVGNPVARIVDLNPILAVGQASQKDIARLKVGDSGRIRLITGQELEGRIRFISAIADPDTRTFRVEMEAENPDYAVKDGLTAELVLPASQAPAHKVSPAILSLTDDGTLGVKTLGPDNRVAFQPVAIVGEDPDGVWLAGLPEQVTLITVGQDYVTVGQSVQAIEETSLEPLVQQGAIE